MSVSRPFRFGVLAAQASSADEWAGRARRAESLGYAIMLVPDTVGPTLSPMPALAIAAAATHSLRVGTYVLANDLRHPVQVARESATLDLLSGGRFELGLGAGRSAEDYRRLGLPFESGGVRLERLAEALGIVKAFLSGRRVDAAGPHYTVASVEPFPRPAQQARPPILLAGSGRRLLSLAAREADIIALGARPDASQDIQERIAWVRQAAGERFDRLELNLNLLAAIPSAAPVPPSVVQRLAWLGVDLDRLTRSGSPFVLTGTPGTMCDQLLERRETLGISYVTVPDDLMELLAPVVERLAGR